jgi:hypothetical protein
MSTDAAIELRRTMMPGRLAGIDSALDGSGVDGAQRDRLRDVLLVFTTSSVRRAFKDFLGYGPDETADRVGWAMRELVASVIEKQGTKGKGKR